MRALLWMAGSAVAFSSMSVFVKRLAPHIPQFELVFFRSLINFCVLLIVMVSAGNPRAFFPEGKPLLVFRGVAGFLGISCLFYSVSHLPLPVATILSWSSPIFVILFSGWFLKERMGPGRLVWVVLAFCGVVLLVNPDLAIPTSATLSLPLGAVAIAVAGSACAALAYVAVRAATARVGVNSITLYFVGISTLLSAPLMTANYVRPNSIQIVEILLLGIFATLAQYMMTQGYRYAQAGIASTANLLNVGFSAVFGWLLFGETLAAVQWLGMILLSTSILGLGRMFHVNRLNITKKMT